VGAEGELARSRGVGAGGRRREKRGAEQMTGSGRQRERREKWGAGWSEGRERKGERACASSLVKGWERGG
jgi:hypothetical protein